MRRYHVTAEGLAHSLLAGPWESKAMVARLADATGCALPWQRNLARACVREFKHRPPHGDAATLARFIKQTRAFGEAWKRSESRPRVVHPTLTSAEMRSVRGPWATAPLPPLATTCELASWLGLDARGLGPFIEPWRQERAKGTAYGLYRYRWVAKRSGRHRLLEIPRPRLRALQRRILDEILVHLPPHEAAHGFVRHRWVGSFAAPHAAQDAVLAMDLEDFFPSIRRERVVRIFMALGYPEGVARALANLCTHAAPRAVWSGGPGSPEPQLGVPHLPQGAPTSPALANLCACRLDMRLSGLARAAGARYTRYADDLAFSGQEPFAASARRLSIRVAAIALEEGFAVNHRKTRLMRASVRQQLAGVVVNVRPTIARADLERLEATLFNCVRHGPAGQNREGHPDFRAHLQGRIAWVAQLRPERATWLRTLFDQIHWT